MLIDSHCHLHDEKFNGNRTEILNRAKKAGVKNFVTIGCDIDTSLKAHALSVIHDDIFFSAKVRRKNNGEEIEYILTEADADLSTFTFENTEVSLPSTLAFIERKQIFYHQNFYNSPDALGVFQPPRYI